MSRLQSYKILPVAALTWPQSHITSITVSGLAPAKRLAANLLTDDEDWKHNVSWHHKDGIWQLCVEPRWGTHNVIAHLFKASGGAR